MNYQLRLLSIGVTLAFTISGSAQVRVTPKESKGGPTYGQYAEPWVDIPETFRDLKVPEWPVPTDLKRWQEVDRARTRATLLRCLGEMPPRPDPARSRCCPRRTAATYTLERFEFHNGVDMVVPGILAHPQETAGPAPAVIGMHGHGGSKREYLPDPEQRAVARPGCWSSRATSSPPSTATSTATASARARRGELDKGRCAGDQPVQAQPLAGPHAVGHDAARRAVPARLPGNPARGRQDADRRHRHEHGLHARLVAGGRSTSASRRSSAWPASRATPSCSRTATCASTASIISSPAS